MNTEDNKKHQRLIQGVSDNSSNYVCPASRDSLCYFLAKFIGFKISCFVPLPSCLVTAAVCIEVHFITEHKCQYVYKNKHVEFRCSKAVILINSYFVFI